MASKSIAAETCRRLAMNYVGLVEAAELFESAAMTEAELSSMSATLTKAREDLAHVQSDVKKGKAVLEQARESVVLMLREADETATAKLQKAEDGAVRIHLQAEESAQQHLNESLGRGQAQLDAMTKEIEKQRATLTLLQAQVTASAKQASDIDQQVNKSQVILEQIKSQARKLTGETA